LIFQRGAPPQASYTFKHALVQDAAYSTLLKATRRTLHGSIATALEERFPEVVDEQPELLAHHCVQAGLVEKAIAYRYKAARQAMARSAMAEAVAQLTQALALLPERVRVTVHGDSEFRGWELFEWLRDHHCDAFLGVQGNTYVSTSADGPRQKLQDWLIDRETVVYLCDVYLTGAAYGPVSVIAWWARDADGEWMVRGVMTNLAASWQTYLRGRRRMWIETVFRDWQSGGFHLDRCGITHRDPVARLLLPLAIAYLWLVSLGRWVVKKGYRCLIDDGTARTWHFSLFQLGVGWKERLASYTLAIPVLLHIYL
jgi:hypothetical protein